MTSLLAIGCTTDMKEIEKSAYNYSYYMANYDLEHAKSYCTPETQETTISYGRSMLELIDSNYIKSDTPAIIEIAKIEKQNDTTAVAFYHKQTPIKDFCGDLTLVKRDGKWLAHCPIKVQNEGVGENKTYKAHTAKINDKDVVLYSQPPAMAESN